MRIFDWLFQFGLKKRLLEAENKLREMEFYQSRNPGNLIDENARLMEENKAFQKQVVLAQHQAQINSDILDQFTKGHEILKKGCKKALSKKMRSQRQWQYMARFAKFNGFYRKGVHPADYYMHHMMNLFYELGQLKHQKKFDDRNRDDIANLVGFMLNREEFTYDVSKSPINQAIALIQEQDATIETLKQESKLSLAQPISRCCKNCKDNHQC